MATSSASGALRRSSTGGTGGSGDPGNCQGFSFDGIKYSPGGSVLASDFAFPMIIAGVHKIGTRRIHAVCGDTMRLPIPDNTFDGATVGFGVRNVASVSDGIRELVRVLKPGGKLVILEFTTPSWQPFRAVYLTYFTKVLPFVGGMISKHGNAYTYLPESVLQFPQPKHLAGIMEGAGLREVKWEIKTGGIVAIHHGVK